MQLVRNLSCILLGSIGRSIMTRLVTSVAGQAGHWFRCQFIMYNLGFVPWIGPVQNQKYIVFASQIMNNHRRQACTRSLLSPIPRDGGTTRAQQHSYHAQS